MNINELMIDNFWHKTLRCGYGAKGFGAAQYNGKMAKTDRKTTRIKLKRFLNKIDKDELENRQTNG